MEPGELHVVWSGLHDGSTVATSTSEGRTDFEIECRCQCWQRHGRSRR